MINKPISNDDELLAAFQRLEMIFQAGAGTLIRSKQLIQKNT